MRNTKAICQYFKSLMSNLSIASRVRFSNPFGVLSSGIPYRPVAGKDDAALLDKNARKVETFDCTRGEEHIGLKIVGEVPEALAASLEHEEL